MHGRRHGQDAATASEEGKIISIPRRIFRSEQIPPFITNIITENDGDESEKPFEGTIQAHIRLFFHLILPVIPNQHSTTTIHRTRSGDGASLLENVDPNALNDLNKIQMK